MKGLIALVLILLCGSMTVYAEDIAFIKNVQGDVTVKRSGTIIPVSQSDNLEAGDILITSSESYVGVIFLDGSVLTLKENSFLRIADFDFKPIEQKFNFHLNLEKGTALFESGKIGDLAAESFKFEIPEGTIGIRGTKFLAEVR